MYAAGNPISAVDARGLKVWFITWGIGSGVGLLCRWGSVYRLHFFDPVGLKRCSYTVYCFGAGVGLPEFGITSAAMRWDDGKGDCSDCKDHSGYGVVSYASAVVLSGFTIGGTVAIPNGPVLTGNMLNADYGSVRIGTALAGCRFQLD